jgi:hypothetical protein
MRHVGTTSRTGVCQEYGERLRLLMLRCLSVDPEQRPTAGEVLQELESLVNAF